MSDVTESVLKGSERVTKALTRFLDVRSGARRFHRKEIGDVNPHKCFGDFLSRISRNDRKGLDSVYQAKSVTNEASGVQGGYLVPQELQDHLLMDVSDAGLFRSRAHCVEMNSLTLDLPYLDATTAPSATGVPPFWGGLNPLPTEEGATLSESEPAFRQLELTAHLIGGYALASRQFLSDAGQTLDDWLYVAFARSMAWVEDWYCFNGTGLDQPLGLINAGASTILQRATHNTFVAGDAEGMLADFYAYGEDCVWAMSYTDLAQLTAFTGWIPNGPLMLHGFDVKPLTMLPALGATGDVILFAPQLYVLGWRPDIQIAVSEYTKTPFLANQNVWRFTERIDGSPLLDDAITLPDGGSNTVASSVVLGSKS